MLRELVISKKYDNYSLTAQFGKTDFLFLEGDILIIIFPESIFCLKKELSSTIDLAESGINR
jgi:hypothetical protein